MDEHGAINLPQPGPKAVTPPHPKRTYAVDGRDRAGLALALGLGILVADLLAATYRGFPGLGITLLVLSWEGAILWYAGGRDALMAVRRGPGLWLTAAVLLLAADFALYSNRWFWLFNLAALPCLMTVQMMELFGRPSCPWWRPKMLAERLLLLVEGLLDHLPASFYTLVGNRDTKNHRLWYVLAGLLVTVPLLGLVLPLLTEADAVFGLMASRAAEFFAVNLSALVVRFLLGLVLAPLLFGLLYFLRHRRGDEAKAAGEEKGAAWRADPALSVTVLAMLDGLYLLFVGVQVRALFGGAAYVAATGLSYAEYARSGFFQLVWVSCINLVVVLTAVQLSRREGRLWSVARWLSTGMVVLSGVLLVSAAWRMSLYVGLYGLSFKRFLTYWGMLMLAIFFGAALRKIWRADFAFFRVFFVASVAGWLLLNAANVDGVVSRYNVSLYQSGNSAVMDLPYLAHLSYAALPALEQLDGTMQAYYDPDRANQVETTLEDLISNRREAARADASNWRTWTLSAARAASGE